MEELYKAIEEKLKAADIPELFPGKRFMRISAIRLTVKKMVPMFYCQNSRMMRFLSITSL